MCAGEGPEGEAGLDRRVTERDGDEAERERGEREGERRGGREAADPGQGNCYQHPRTEGIVNTRQTSLRFSLMFECTKVSTLCLMFEGTICM